MPQTPHSDKKIASPHHEPWTDQSLPSTILAYLWRNPDESEFFLRSKQEYLPVLADRLGVDVDHIRQSIQWFGAEQFEEEVRLCPAGKALTWSKSDVSKGLYGVGLESSQCESRVCETRTNCVSDAPFGREEEALGHSGF